MTEPVTLDTAPAADAMAAVAPAAETAAPVVDAPAAEPSAQPQAPAERAPRSDRRGRGPRRPGGAPGHDGGKRPANAPAPERRPARTHPVLEQLAGFYPALFGAEFKPLKRGIFHDLQAAHPDLFEKDALKLALSIHTRSTRYLTAVASGLPRHDLQGAVTEPMAPEHVYIALLEVFRRRQSRGGEDLSAKLRQRIVQAFEASGLSREDYDARVRGRDEAANALLDQALAEAGERIARDEAQLRAYEASGQSSVQGFADMYGLDPRVVMQTLVRARRRRPA